MWRKTGTLVIIFSVSTALVTVFLSSPFNKQMLCYVYCSNGLCESKLRTLLSYHHHQPQQQPPSSGFSDDELIPTLLWFQVYQKVKCFVRSNGRSGEEVDNYSFINDSIQKVRILNSQRAYTKEYYCQI